MKILSQIYVGNNKFLLTLKGKASELASVPSEYVADGSRFIVEDTDAVYAYDSGWEIADPGQMKDLPVVTATDNGKILKVANGVWSIGTDESGGGGSSLPDMTGKNGKILGVTLNQDDEEQAEWVDVTTPLVVSEFTPDPEDQTHLICDYTSQQLFDAMRAGRSVAGSFGEGVGAAVIPFGGAAQVSSTSVVFFVPDFEHGGFDSWERVLADPFWISAE